MIVKRLESGKYEVQVDGPWNKPWEDIVFVGEEDYQPTDQELEAEALLWDWIDGRSA